MLKIYDLQNISENDNNNNYLIITPVILCVLWEKKAYVHDILLYV